MVTDHLMARGISDAGVLAAMRKVPREEFVPALMRPMAYRDSALPIGESQTISQPYIVALMTEHAKIRKGSRVLEVGTGSGYQAAILAELGADVHSIELLPGLAAEARKTLDRLGYKAVKTRTGDGYLGWPEAAPFDVIMVTCAPEDVPKPLVQQLKVGGRIVIPVGPENGVQRLVLLEKHEDKLEERTIELVQFVPMVRSSPK